jgi:hypothetical protein
MIVVNLRRNWPRILDGELTPEEGTLGAWYHISDRTLNADGDVLLGVFGNEVVNAFDITGWTRDDRGCVTFVAKPSDKWRHLIGGPNPGKRWRKGQARPIQVVRTADIPTATVRTSENAGGEQRAIVGGYTLIVSLTGEATLQVPKGAQVTVRMQSG